MMIRPQDSTSSPARNQRMQYFAKYHRAYLLQVLRSPTVLCIMCLQIYSLLVSDQPEPQTTRTTALQVTETRTMASQTTIIRQTGCFILMTSSRHLYPISLSLRSPSGYLIPSTSWFEALPVTREVQVLDLQSESLKLHREFGKSMSSTYYVTSAEHWYIYISM